MPVPERSRSDRRLGNDSGLSRIINRLSKTLQRDEIVEQVTHDLQRQLQVDRVVLYYFHQEWEGRVTFEALSAPQYSIFGSTGPDECFNDEYAALYLAGRVRAIADIDAEPIADCHREFLQAMQVRANLVVPVLTPKGLWGLLVAHHCQSVRPWSDEDVALMRAGAEKLAFSPAIRNNAA